MITTILRALTLIAVMAAGLAVTPSAGAAVTVTGKFSDGSLLASGTPSYRLAAGNSYAVGDYVVLEVIQNTHAIPGAVTDSLGNTYRQINVSTADDYTNLDANGQPTALPLGFALYVAQVTAGGSRPTLTFHLSATGMVGIRVYTGVNLGLNTRGRPMAPISDGISSRTGSPFLTSAQAQNVGDIVMACVVAMSGSVTFNPDSFATPGWTTVTTFQGNGISLQVLEIVPTTTPSDPIAGWDTTPANTTAIVSAIGLPHA